MRQMMLMVQSTVCVRTEYHCMEQRRPALRARYPTRYGGKVITDSASPILLFLTILIMLSHSGFTRASPSSAPPPSKTTRTPRSFSAPHSNTRRISSPTPAPRLPRPLAHRQRRQRRGERHLPEVRPWPQWWGDTGKWWWRG